MTAPLSNQRLLPTPSNTTILFISYRSYFLLKSQVPSLISNGFSVCIVDNFGEPELRDFCFDYSDTLNSDQLSYINPQDNLGFGRGANLGLISTRNPYVLLCNPDAALTLESFSHLSQALIDFPKALLVAPLLLKENGSLFFKNHSLLNKKSTAKNKEYLRKSIAPTEACPVLNASGACLLLDREGILSLGAFDEKIFLYYEDDDLSRRVRESGFELILQPKAKISHLGGKSSMQDPDLDEKEQETTEMELIYWKHFHFYKSEQYVRKKWGLRRLGRGALLRARFKLLRSIVFSKKADVAKFKGILASLSERKNDKDAAISG